MRGIRKLLLFADEPVLVQQMRLVVGSMRSSFWPATLLVLLVRFALRDHTSVIAMNLWCVATIVMQLNVALFVRRFDSLVDRSADPGVDQPLSSSALDALIWWLMLNTLMGGTAWGTLIWLAPHDATLAQSSLIIAVVAVVLCGAVTTVSPLMPVFMAFLLPTIVIMALKVDPHSIAHNADAALGCALYVITLYDQARKGAIAARSAIELRFENAALLVELRGESTALLQARREAELASAAKSKILAAASHDLRQPVHAQGLFLDVLSKTALTTQQRELVAHASAAVAASGNMLSTLFDFSRIEAGVIVPQRQAFAMQPLLNKIEREFAPQADAQRLNFRARESRLVVDSDPALVELILRNLVSNAIRYTPRGGLLVACRTRGGHAVLEVWDTGIGIERSHQREVFREFHQLHNLERDRRKGFGLGLAIVEGLARTLGHSLSLASRPGRGSVFRLALPLSDTPADAIASAVPAVAPRRLDARILVIDDDESIQSGMLELLTSWGCECDVAASIESAIELATRHAPDLVISDYRLADERSGLDAIVGLRETLGQRFAALVVTGDTAPGPLDEAAVAGVTLLHKPVSPGQLYRSVVTALP
jgi:signal transduction histidine kinase